MLRDGKVVVICELCSSIYGFTPQEARVELGRSTPSSWPGIAVRRTESLPLAYARPSTPFCLNAVKSPILRSEEGCLLSCDLKNGN